MGIYGNGWEWMGVDGNDGSGWEWMGGNGIIKKKGKGEDFEFAKLRITR